MKSLMLALVLLLLFSSVSAQEGQISPALNEQLDDLVTVAERLRGLDTLEPVERAFPTRQETIDYLTGLYDAELPAEEMERSQLLYVALDLLPADVDLREVYLRLLGAQVAGFYDSDTRIMNVLPTVGDDVGEELSLTEQMVFVHEYTHALQDQHFGLSRLEDETLQATPDRSLAATALVEGDATATMEVYSQQIVMQNPAAAFQLLSEGLMAGNLMLPEDTPEVLARELMFPYEVGLSFVLAMYDEGGWDSINAAYDNLPQTTEQVLHPEKYLAGEGAVPVDELSAGLGDEWNEIWNISLGEFYLAEHLRTQLSSTLSNRAAAGWGGDRFQVYTNADNDLVWTLHLVWDTPADAAEFAEAYAELGQSKFGEAASNGCWSNDDTTLCFVSDEGGSLIVSAPSLELAQGILAPRPTA